MSIETRHEVLSHEHCTRSLLFYWLVNTHIRQQTDRHDCCTLIRCDRNNAEVSTYKQSHCEPGCNCVAFFPDLARIVKILQQDQLPIIRVDYDTEQPQLSIEAANKGSFREYVAISHVWVDGLGGSTEKGLDTCQVLRLSTLVNNTTGRPAGESAKFWIGSLCIPSHKSNVYVPALIGIRDVYSCVTSVLIIDKLVQQCSSTDLMEILFASIYMSAWMQRMWTFEEAVLARRLIFPVRVDRFHEYNPDADAPAMRSTVSMVWRTIGTQLFCLRVPESKFNIGHVYRAFRFYLKNAKGDEYLSIGSMLKFNARQMKLLNSAKRDEGARDFWLLLRTLPSNVVFIEGPKLPYPGFRWAPKTLMHPATTQLSTISQSLMCVCTQHGLYGTYLHLEL